MFLRCAPCARADEFYNLTKSVEAYTRALAIVDAPSIDIRESDRVVIRGVAQRSLLHCSRRILSWRGIDALEDNVRCAQRLAARISSTEAYSQVTVTITFTACRMPCCSAQMIALSSWELSGGLQTGKVVVDGDGIIVYLFHVSALLNTEFTDAHIMR